MVFRSAFFLATASSVSAEDAGAILRKVGYPEKRVSERAACGERHFQAKNMDYYVSMLFHGFRSGTCAEIGYKTEEEPAKDDAGHTINVFSRDPTMMDVVECLGEECGAEMSTLSKDGYSSDVGHCISPAFGPCVPRAWDCLGDSTCLEAVECGPKFARTCGNEVAKLMSDPDEREKVMCVQNCGKDVGCIVLKCGKDALDCLDGKDKICHDAVECIPKGLADCSKPAVKCLFDTSGLCHQNLECLGNGASICADPAVNMLTNAHIADVVKCANAKCPSALTEELSSVPESSSQPAHYPMQLACIGIKCQPLVHLLKDEQLQQVLTCAAEASDSCDVSIWDCLGDHGCQSQLHCWADGLGAATDDFWKMLTDDKERAFDVELVQCVESCDNGNKIADALCVAGKCGVKALKCMSDTTCKAALLDIPKVVSKCGPTSRTDAMFMKGVHCAGEILGQCGKAGLDIVRDTALGDLVTCQAQCTRTPGNSTLVV
jgi:hypothetical protein